MAQLTEINGYWDQRFLPVKKAFADNFKAGLETGASFAVTLNGEYVVDIWGGYSNATKTIPWNKNTITNVYSTVKVMTALCALILIDKGQLSLDSPVAEYWPEFAQAGKDKITVRHVLSHSTGLSGFDQPITMEDMYDWEKIIELLERQKPWWEPGAQSGYHMVTFGYLVGELIRRVTGKSIGTFFRDEVANPLEADFHISLAQEHDVRVAELIPPPPMDPPPIDPGSIIGKTLYNSPIIPAYSDRKWRAAEIPSSNGHGNARSTTRIGSFLACGGELDGVRLLSQDTINMVIEEQFNGIDLILGEPVRWGLGFGLANDKLSYLSPRTFYWGGFGGSWLEMDPDNKMCFSYVMNKLELNIDGDKRMLALRKALLSVV